PPGTSRIRSLRASSRSPSTATPVPRATARTAATGRARRRNRPGSDGGTAPGGTPGSAPAPASGSAAGSPSPAASVGASSSTRSKTYASPSSGSRAMPQSVVRAGGPASAQPAQAGAGDLDEQAADRDHRAVEPGAPPLGAGREVERHEPAGPRQLPRPERDGDGLPVGDGPEGGLVARLALPPGPQLGAGDAVQAGDRRAALQDDRVPRVEQHAREVPLRPRDGAVLTDGVEPLHRRAAEEPQRLGHVRRRGRRVDEPVELHDDLAVLVHQRAAA